MQTILDLFTPKEVLNYTENSPNREYLGRELFPERKSRYLDFEILKGGRRLPVVASVHAFDTEAVIRTRRAEKQDMSLALVKHKKRLTEEEIIKLESPRSRDEQEYLMRNVYNDIDSLTDGVYAKAEVFRMEALTEGKITVKENNLNLTVDYNVPVSNKEQLTGTAQWSDANADPIADIQRWSDVLNGGATRAITSTKVMSLLLRNAKVISAVVGVAGRMPTRNELNNFLAAQGLPTIRTYDDFYEVEEVNGAFTKKRYFNEDAFVMFGSDRLGETIFGPTAEEIRLTRDPSIETNMIGNVFTTVYESNTDPVSTWIKAVATVMPSFPAADSVFQAKVVVS